MGLVTVAGFLVIAALAQGAVRLTADEIVRIGSDAAPEYEFTVVRDAVLDRAGNLYVLLPHASEIRVFAPDGRFVRRIGRKGQGPGEFMWPLALGWRGDSLWVRDTELARVTLFDAEGRVARAISKQIPAVAGRYRAGPPAALLSDGALLGVGDAPTIMAANGQISAVPMVRYEEHADGAQLIRDLSLAHAYGNQPPSRSRPGIHFVQRLADSPLWDVAADGSAFVVVDRLAASNARTAEFVVTVYRPSGTVRTQRHVTYRPRPVSRAFRDSVIEQTLNPRGRAGISYEDDVVFTPGFRPPVTQVHLDRNGRVWLRREFTFSSEITWDILDGDLKTWGNVRLPADLKFLEAAGDTLWGSRTTSDDVPNVIRYRLKQSR